MPPLPPDAHVIRKDGATAAFELQVLRIEVAAVERLADGRWLTRVGLLWSERLQHEAVAGTPRQARRWVQAWLRAQMPRINRARPVMPGIREMAPNHGGLDRACDDPCVASTFGGKRSFTAA
jgi:hypothetical protein